MTVTLINQLLKTRSLWVVLASVLIAEITVRLALPDGKIPKGAYHSSEFREQVRQYQATVPVDMMIIGSSVAAVNYPPAPLDERLRQLGQSEFRTFNAGIRGCNYECIAVGVQRHYLSEYQPPIVLVALSPADLNIDNSGVVARSQTFAADMERSTIGRTGRNLLSSISYLYGFKEEVRDWLTSGDWNFDPAVQGERGYIDMGSTERRRNMAVPNIKPDSYLSVAFSSLVEQLADTGTAVILLPVEGDSLARMLFSVEARAQLRTLLNRMTEHPNIHELFMDMSGIPDSDYIDTIHLNSVSAVANAKRLGSVLMDSGLLGNP